MNERIAAVVEGLPIRASAKVVALREREGRTADG